MAATTDCLDQTGQCLCGTVKFRVNGKIIFNELCHCRACGRARSATPVHLIGVNGDFSILEGKDHVKTFQGMGSMIHSICDKCGGGLYQHPKGKNFYATYPTSFRIETPSTTDVPSSMLPPYLRPTHHTNYENRQWNYEDSLPKYKTFDGAGAVLLNNHGQVIGKDGKGSGPTIPDSIANDSTPASADGMIDQKGQCVCGKVKFRVKGKLIFNTLCHCRACSRARAMTPAHLLGVRGDFSFEEGEDHTKTVQGMGKLHHVICGSCGTGLYQRPEAAPENMYVTHPTSFQIETEITSGTPSSMLPSYLLPTSHGNYENRLLTFYDDLPKYKTWSRGPRMTNEGEILSKTDQE